jgi:hypothetical protein
VDYEHDSLIGLTASRMYAKSSSDPGHSTPLRHGSVGGRDGVVPGTPGTPGTPGILGTPDMKKQVPDGCEIEYLIRQRTVGNQVHVIITFFFPSQSLTYF